MKRILLLWALCLMVSTYAQAQYTLLHDADFLTPRASQDTKFHNQTSLVPLRENVLMQRLDSVVLSNWDQVMSSFTPNEKQILYYDGNSRSVYDITYYWKAATHEYIPDRKKEYGYNDANQVASVTYYNYSVPIYEPRSQAEYYYNTNGTVNYILVFYWNSSFGFWQYAYKYSYEYDTNDNNTQIDVQKWDNMAHDWEYIEQATYEYDSNNNNILELGQVFESGAWKNSYKINLSCNASNELIQRLYLENSNFSFSPVWVPVSRIDYTRDSYGNPIIAEHYHWDTISFSYQKKYKHNLSFNTSYPVSEIYTSPDLQHGLTYNYKTMITADDFMQYNAITATYDNQGRVTFHYSAHDITSIFENDAAAQVIVYPNPSSDQIQFGITDMNEVLQVQIYDMQGKLVLNQLINADEKISISDLQNGVYMCKISTNEKLMTSKLIKQ